MALSQIWSHVTISAGTVPDLDRDLDRDLKVLRRPDFELLRTEATSLLSFESILNMPRNCA